MNGRDAPHPSGSLPLQFSMAYTPKQRLAYVRMHLEEGRSLRWIEKTHGFNRKELAEWVRRYKTQGVEGVLGKSRIRATYETRRQIVAEHLDKGVSFKQLCESHDVNLSTLKKWVATVRTSGYDALRGKRD